MGGGPKFQDEKNPKAMVQVGDPWTYGILEISDIVFATVGPGGLLIPHVQASLAQSNSTRCHRCSVECTRTMGCSGRCGDVGQLYSVCHPVQRMLLTLTKALDQDWRRCVLS